MRNSIFTLLFTFFITSINCTNYYVSSKTGNDDNVGTSPKLPFASITKINSLVLSPGDSILLCCGNIFRGQIIIKQSGTETKPIVISTYGTGAPPFVCGSEVIEGNWSVFAGNIYKTMLMFNPSYVFVNDNWHTIARSPNASNTGSYFELKNDKTTSTTSSNNPNFISKDLIGKNDLIGSYVTINTLAKTTQTGIIKNFNSASGLVTLDTNNYGKIYNWNEGTLNEYGIIVSNKLQFLDQEREFYYDSSMMTLYLESYDRLAPKGLIEGSIYEYGIQLPVEGQNHITIRGISFRHQKNAGIILPENNSNIIVDHCDFANLSTAISTSTSNTSSNFLRISYNLIQHAFKAGMMLGKCLNTDIVGNSIQDCAPLVNMAEWMTAGNSNFSNSQSGIELNGNATIISENRIEQVGQSGITISGYRNVIHHNEILNCSFLFFNCGGIAAINLEASIIKENIIHEIKIPQKNVPGMFQGKTIGAAYPAGIYVEAGKIGNSDSLQFIGNVIYNSSNGIEIVDYLNSSIVKENIFYNINNCSIAIMILHEGSGKVVHKMKISSNSFYNIFSTTYAISFENNYDKLNPTVNFAACDSNNYYFLSGKGLYNLQPYNSIKKYCSAKEWKENGNDLNSYFFMDADLQKSTPVSLAGDSIRAIPLLERFPIFVNNSTQQKNLKLKAKGYTTIEGKEIPEVIISIPCSAVILRNDHPPVGNKKTVNGRG